MSGTAPNGSDRVELARIAEMEDYGASIAAELAGAEAELDSPLSRPFRGLSEEVMADIGRLRKDQLDIFRQHIEIEQRFNVPRPASDSDDVRDIRFSSIASAMRQKEVATSRLLDRLDKIDRDLRNVIGKFERGDPNVATYDQGLPSGAGLSDNRDFISPEKSASPGGEGGKAEIFHPHNCSSP